MGDVKSEQPTRQTSQLGQAPLWKQSLRRALSWPPVVFTGNCSAHCPLFVVDQQSTQGLETRNRGGRPLKSSGKQLRSDGAGYKPALSTPGQVLRDRVENCLQWRVEDGGVSRREAADKRDHDDDGGASNSDDNVEEAGS
ncbi:hypothetical protein MTO96_002778 [Rhipicephalus appendiculatus]